MVLYRCFRCGYNTNHRNSIKNHLNRKNICNPLLDNMSIEKIKNYYGFENESKITTNNTQTTPKQHPNNTFCENKMTPKQHLNNTLLSPKQHLNDTQTTPKSSTRECQYCRKTFTRKSGLTKHLNICIIKKEHELLIHNQNEEITVMKKEIEELKKYKGINTQNNITHNNINNTININNYGDEDLSFLKSKDFLQLFGGIYGAIPKLIEKIHFNPKYPENHNIKYTNKKLPYLKIRKDNKWQLVNKKHELLDLIDNKCFMLRERYYKILEKNKYNITEFQKSKIEEFMQKYHEEDKKMTLDLIERTELMLLNNS